MDPANLLTKRHWIVELARRKPGAVLYSLNHVIDFEWMRPALPAGRKVVAQVAGPTNAPACPILGQLQRDPRTPPTAPPPDRPSLQPSSPVKNRMRAICTSGLWGASVATSSPPRPPPLKRVNRDLLRRPLPFAREWRNARVYHRARRRAAPSGYCV